MPSRTRRITGSFNQYNVQIVYIHCPSCRCATDGNHNDEHGRDRHPRVNVNFQTPAPSGPIWLSDDEDEQVPSGDDSASLASSLQGSTTGGPPQTQPASPWTQRFQGKSKGKGAPSDDSPRSPAPSGQSNKQRDTQKGKQRAKSPASSASSSVSVPMSAPSAADETLAAQLEADEQLARHLSSLDIRGLGSDYVTYHNEALGYTITYRPDPVSSTDGSGMAQAGPSRHVEGDSDGEEYEAIEVISEQVQEQNARQAHAHASSHQPGIVPHIPAPAQPPVSHVVQSATPAPAQPLSFTVQPAAPPVQPAAPPVHPVAFRPVHPALAPYVQYPTHSSMATPRRGGKVKFYAVTRGRRVGIFDTWDDVADVIRNCDAVFKSYPTQAEAIEVFENARRAGRVHIIDPYTGNWTRSPMKKKAQGQPQASASRPTKKSKNGTFRLAKDPDAKPVIATTLRHRSSGTTTLGRTHANAATTIPSTSDNLSETSFLGGTDNQIEMDSSVEQPIIDGSDPIESEQPIFESSRKRRTNTTSSQLKEWLAFRSICLDEMIRLNGKSDQCGVEHCSACRSETILYRCQGCAGRCLLYCQQCLVDRHRFMPLHRIEEWNGKYFQKTSLKQLGLRIQLGHGGEPCLNPIEGPSSFTLFDVTGVHELSVDFCDCREFGFAHRRTQVLRFGWLPASYERPKTAFTYEVLNFFHELTLQGKTNVYDFYHTILRITDNLQLEKTTYRYKEFHRACRIWRHLKPLKWSGRAHVLDGASSTSEGSLAIECPACPHPGKNLPVDWRDAPVHLQFLYTLFIAVDANFKLKSKERGIRDLELAPGWSYYVEDKRYQAHLANYVDQPEINTCRSEHTAVVRANCSVPGYSINGAGVAICARHSMIRANGAADLSKGEKYCSMDYLILSALIGVTILRVLISYDIACQWAKNLRKRLQEYPPELQIPLEVNIETGIPSWHVNGHVGRTCGEDVETTWANTNHLVPSTREMGPSARRETLNHHWGGWNFRKIVGFRSLFIKRFKEAKKLRIKHSETFAQFTSTFPPETISRWTKMVEDWQRDRTMPNPYEEPFNVASYQDVRLELAKEDAEDAARGASAAHETSVGEFLTKGLELEENQRTLLQEISKFKGRRTNKQIADLQQKRTSLYRRIQNWRVIQIAYMPIVAPLIINSATLTSESDSPDPQVDQPEKIPLYMPSSLASDLLGNPTIASISQKECRLRIAQADQGLADIRRGRRILTGYSQFKKLNISGTGNKPNTRMRSMYNRMQNKIERAAQRYREAYSALLRLDPGGPWKDRFRKLENADIRGPGKDDIYESTGRFEPSWIWLVSRSASSHDPETTDDVFDGSLRTEWTKSMARRDRWEEEYLLVQEEMRRVVVYLGWKASWWRRQGEIRQVHDLALAEGLTAYAEKQASNWEKLAESCAFQWVPVLMAEGITPDWAAPYPAVVAFAHRALAQVTSNPQVATHSSTNPEHNTEVTRHDDDQYTLPGDLVDDMPSSGEEDETELEQAEDDFDMYDFEL